MLVLFLSSAASPPRRLTDPRIIGSGASSGVWELVFVHAASSRAFYVRVAHILGRLAEDQAAM
ncbi:MAG: hypothetical protein JWM51_145 [Microbacteriaceae bacterium]|nr:hypothetical protein [Microbacteriaceae bacterium]